jgi:hypothetical protein
MEYGRSGRGGDRHEKEIGLQEAEHHVAPLDFDRPIDVLEVFVDVAVLDEAVLNRRGLFLR